MDMLDGIDDGDYRADLLWRAQSLALEPDELIEAVNTELGSRVRGLPPDLNVALASPRSQGSGGSALTAGTDGLGGDGLDSLRAWLEDQRDRMLGGVGLGGDVD